ncbi:ROK family protein [Cohnella rhizosphaerae]|uniref:ROK family protein n=1 Tax=Cohnella rhizosphaerae TaxID=1457232 RepID=A0A9X4KSY4_9BACL|nr:ROK family protein [Cohnella rhizosphaerae]MDG0810168.1 ROK family protein [Cohnella rhizosphaerae]
MRRLLGGLDIGGTKCAAVIGAASETGIDILGKTSFPTPATPEATMSALIAALEALLAEHGGPIGMGGDAAIATAEAGAPPEPDGTRSHDRALSRLAAIGVSCGGPLDSEAGLVLSPPNLPGWDAVDVLAPLRERFGVPAALQNDANACALAEWRWGAGRGTRHMAFLTFGTGMGAGLILNGRLYAGANDMAGEVGHIRLREDGPVGYGKAGSFEGFCSGGGMARLGIGMTEEWLQAGKTTALPTGADAETTLTARLIFEAARAGDELAALIVRVTGIELGRGLAVMVDVLNPEAIVIGSIYARQEPLLAPIVLETLRREALPRSLAACRILPSQLRENVGDAASLSVALHALEA